MAQRTVQTCDFPVADGEVCGAPAAMTFDGKIGSRRVYAGDFCAEHRTAVEVGLRALGIAPRAAITDYKSRGVHVAASGATFSTAEARRWLMDKGFIDSMAGRVSAENLERYAAAH